MRLNAAAHSFTIEKPEPLTLVHLRHIVAPGRIFIESDARLYNIITYLHADTGFLPLPSLNCNRLTFLFSFRVSVTISFTFSNHHYEYFHREPESPDVRKTIT